LDGYWIGWIGGRVGWIMDRVDRRTGLMDNG